MENEYSIDDLFPEIEEEKNDKSTIYCRRDCFIFKLKLDKASLDEVLTVCRTKPYLFKGTRLKKDMREEHYTRVRIIDRIRPTCSMNPDKLMNLLSGYQRKAMKL